MGNRLIRGFLPDASSNQLPTLDVIRAAAVLLVFFHHAWVIGGAPLLEPSLPIIGEILIVRPLISGGVGVDIFFVLSGFLLSMSWHRNHFANKPGPSLRTYARRRVLRIGPPYWFCVAMMLLLLTGGLIPWSEVWGGHGFKQVAAHGFFAQYLFPFSTSSFGGINGSLWTLTIEIIFYAVLPITIWAFVGRRWMIGLPLAFLASFLWTEFAWRTDVLANLYSLEWMGGAGVESDSLRLLGAYQFPGFAWQFALGIAVANLWVGREYWSRFAWFHLLTSKAGASVATLAGVVLLISALWIGPSVSGRDAFWLNSAVGLATGLLIFGSLNAPRFLKAPMSVWPMRIIGIVGYSIFLWHMPIMRVIDTWPGFGAGFGTTGFAKLTIASVLIMAVLGPVLYFLVEKPFLGGRFALWGPLPKPADKSVTADTDGGLHHPPKEDPPAPTKEITLELGGSVTPDRVGEPSAPRK